MGVAADIQDFFVAFNRRLVERFFVGTVASVDHVDIIAFRDKMMANFQRTKPVQIVREKADYGSSGNESTPSGLPKYGL